MAERPAKKKRFGSPKSSSVMDSFRKGYVPSNTKKNTSWALGVFNTWREERNKDEKSAEQCPLDLLERPTALSLNHWLTYFVVEARRADGQPYPPNSINNILAGLYRYSREHDQSYQMLSSYTKDLHWSKNRWYQRCLFKERKALLKMWK